MYPKQNDLPTPLATLDDLMGTGDFERTGREGPAEEATQRADAPRHLALTARIVESRQARRNLHLHVDRSRTPVTQGPD